MEIRNYTPTQTRGSADAELPLPVPRVPDLSGRILGARYSLRRRIGGGSMGTVYEARDMTLGTAVAVKVMRPGLASDPDFVERFAREARAAARLSSPEVVAVHDQGTDAATGTAYLVMERVSGGTLRDEVDGSTDEARWFRPEELADLRRVKLVEIGLRMAGLLA